MKPIDPGIRSLVPVALVVTPISFTLPFKSSDIPVNPQCEHFFTTLVRFIQILLEFTGSAYQWKENEKGQAICSSGEHITYALPGKCLKTSTSFLPGPNNLTLHIHLNEILEIGDVDSETHWEVSKSPFWGYSKNFVAMTGSGCMLKKGGTRNSTIHIQYPTRTVCRQEPSINRRFHGSPRL